MAAYQIEIKKSVLKDFKIYAREIVSRIFAKIESLSVNPRPHGSIKLHSSEKSYRLRVGDYRIVYQIDDANKRVIVFGVGHRKEIYRDS